VLKIILVNSEGLDRCLLFIKRIYVTSFQNLGTVFKVSRLSNSFEVVDIHVIDSVKYLCYYSIDDKLLYICQLPNTYELE